MADLVRHRVAVIATPGSSGSGCHNSPINHPDTLRLWPVPDCMAF
jgi:hypothetical protein